MRVDLSHTWYSLLPPIYLLPISPIIRLVNLPDRTYLHRSQRHHSRPIFFLAKHGAPNPNLSPIGNSPLPPESFGPLHQMILPRQPLIFYAEQSNHHKHKQEEDNNAVV